MFKELIWVKEQSLSEDFCNQIINKFETINEIDVNWFRSEVGVHNNPLRKKMPRSSFHFNPEVGG